MTPLERHARWLEAVCLFFALLGVLLPVAFPTPPFTLYRDAVGSAVGDASVLDLCCSRRWLGPVRVSGRDAGPRTAAPRCAARCETPTRTRRS